MQPAASSSAHAATYEVREAVDLYAPRQAVLRIAHAAAFARNDGHELAIVVSELASNILKYGVRGTISFDLLAGEKVGAIGLVILAVDQGPPFHNLEYALRDGYDDRGPIDPGTLMKRGGLGTGLGAVVRLTDSFAVETLQVGKAIRVVRYRVRPKNR